jgi:S-adenosylmethionine:tRNA ribosyltransferase-isomerase
MKTSDFSFDLPAELIAKYPPPHRGESRLMVLDRSTGKRLHRTMADLPLLLAELRSGSGALPLLVFNNSRVRKARLKAVSLDTAAAAEFLLLSRIDCHTWKTMVSRAKRRRPGSRYRFEGDVEGEIVGESAGGFRLLRFDTPIDDTWLDLHGHIPLPPYINREDDASDSERYQTVYADGAAGAGLGPGASAAAPTAGLHFSGEMLDTLAAANIETVFVTLHVGLGTFLPVRSETVADHVMHEEVYSISEAAARRINGAKERGRKIVAVGTTAVRTLESAWRDEGKRQDEEYIQAGEGSTSIFIYPGYRFKAVDALFTNFHTPCSTLLMLVSAFAEQASGKDGRELILESYAEAVREGYRFFSYGDAMLIRDMTVNE